MIFDWNNRLSLSENAIRFKEYLLCNTQDHIDGDSVNRFFSKLGCIENLVDVVDSSVIPLHSNSSKLLLCVLGEERFCEKIKNK